MDLYSSLDDKRFRSRVLGLAYTDLATGQGTMFAVLKPEANGVVLGTLVLYPDCFEDGVVASLRYSYTLAGFEQDLIIHNQIPAPEAFGLNSASTRLELYTEFLEAPEAAKATVVLNAQTGLRDDILDFGALRIGTGNAFPTDDPEDTMQTGKSWEIREGRRIMVEAVDYISILDYLNRLPPGEARVDLQKRTKETEKEPRMNANRRELVAEAKNDLQKGTKETKGRSLVAASRESAVERNGKSAALSRDAATNGKRRELLAGKVKLPKRPELGKPPAKMEMAKAAVPMEGFVIDYQIMGSSSNFTLRGDTEYRVTNTVNLTGTTTIEGGTVVRFASNNSLPKLVFQGPIECKTYPHLPATFTAWTDPTIGESAPSGPLSGYYGRRYIELNNSATTFKLENVRLRHAKEAIYVNANNTLELGHSQIGFGDRAIGTGSGVSLTLRNALIHEQKTAFYIAAAAKCEQATFHRIATKLVDGSAGGALNLTKFYADQRY